MLWKTHIRISNEVLRRLDITLSSDAYSRFKAGVIAPDQWRDFPHHRGKYEQIRRNLQYARQYFLQDNIQETYYYLGVAFHYIQDSYTSVISYNSPYNLQWHNNYEQSIEDSKFVYDLENTIQYFFRDDYCQLDKYSMIAKRLATKVEGKEDTIDVATLVGGTQSQQTGKPIVDLNLALKACIVVAESVISSRINPKLDLNLKQALANYNELLRKTELASSKEIINLAKNIEEMKRQKLAGKGFFFKLKNIFSSLRIMIKESQLNNKYSDYVKKKHLFKINTYYETEINRIIYPHVGWYNFTVPQLKFSIIKKELIPLHEADTELAEYSLELMGTSGVRNFKIGNQDIIVREELIRFITQQLLLH